jgi:plastocyanin
VSHHKWFFGGLILAAMLGLSSCAGDDDAGAAFIDMKDNFFGREVTRIPEGQAVLFKNDGNSPHNAIAADGSWSTEDVAGKLPIDPGENVTVTVKEPGVYEYFCSFHGTEDGDGMAAVLVVGDVAFVPGSGVAEQDPVSEWSGRTIEVPRDFDSIQSAIDAANPGDLVLISPGIYREEVTVTTPSMTLRGTDRNEVIIDGEFERPNGVQVFADGVAIENMTARNAQLNGFLWTGVTGYRGSYLTAYNNADYGIFAFDSIDGVFEHSYASGSPDSGFYIGQCYPCDAVINEVVAERNSLGYSGTNAGGDLLILNSRWVDNRAGIVPNTLDSELLPPERETTIAGNYVARNHNRAPVAKAGTYAAFGNGIVLAGGIGNRVLDNVIEDHEHHGILVTPNLDENFWPATHNAVIGNSVRGSGRADLALSGLAGPGNCFANNGFDSSSPVGLQQLQGCADFRLPLGGDLSTLLLTAAYVADAPPQVDYEDVGNQAAPENQPQMPAGAEVKPAVDVFANYDAGDASHYIDEEVHMSSVFEGPSPWQLLFGLYGYLLPLVLLAAWVSLAFWDLARRDDIGRGTGIVWILVILLVPFLGVIAYHAFAARNIAGWLRLAMVGGGVVVYLAILAIGASIGGIV